MKVNLTDAAMFTIAVVGIYSWFITKSIKTVLTKEERDEKGQHIRAEFRERIDGRA